VHSERQKVAVAGATGRTGRLIVDELLKRGFQVRALVRSAEHASWLKQADVELVEYDLTSIESIKKAIEGVDFLISAIGSKRPFNKRENNKVDNIGNQNLAKAAKEKGIKHIVVISSIGVGNSRYAINPLFRFLMGPVLKMKEKSENFIKSCGIDYTILRPGGLKDKELSGDVCFGEGGKLSGYISRRQVAKICVDALTNASMRNRTLEIVDSSTVKQKQRPFVIEIDKKQKNFFQ